MVSSTVSSWYRYHSTNRSGTVCKRALGYARCLLALPLYGIMGETYGGLVLGSGASHAGFSSWCLASGNLTIVYQDRKIYLDIRSYSSLKRQSPSCL